MNDRSGQDMDMRELKGLEIAARCRIVFTDGVWLVPSQSSLTTKYRVTIGASPSCDCDDFALIGATGRVCKHILAAKLTCERDNGEKAPVIATDAVPKRPTYRQDWPAYNEAQMTEKDRFQELLYDLCSQIEDPPQLGRGRRRTPTADMVFCCALKVFTGFSSRRFACDLRDAHEKGYLSSLMNSVTVCEYLNTDALTPILERLIVQTSLPLKAVETVFAPDSTGFSTSRFVRWHDEKYGTERSGRDWVKAHAICGTKTNIITSVIIDGRDTADCPQFKPLVEKTAENFDVREVPADKAYLSRENLQLLENMGGTAYVPFKSNSIAGEAGTLWERMFFYYQFRRDEFLKKYHARSNIESAFSMVKAKFRDHVRSRVPTAMKNEVLTKFLCHNIVVVHQSNIELGIEPVFWPEDKKPQAAPALLRFPG